MPLLLPTPEAQRLWSLLERSDLLVEDEAGVLGPDYEKIVRIVQECQLDETFRPWVIRCALDGSRPLTLEYARELCDTLSVDLRVLAYDAPPEPRPKRPMRIEEVLRMKV